MRADTLPPIVQLSVLGGASRQQTLTDGPVRPFSTSGGVLRTRVDGTVITTKTSNITFAFNTTTTEGYDGNGATSYQCRVTTAGNRDGLYQDCESPLALQSLQSLGRYTTAPPTGRDTYTLEVLPRDHAGNVGAQAAISWGVGKAVSEHDRRVSAGECLTGGEGRGVAGEGGVNTWYTYQPYASACVWPLSKI